MNRRTIKKINYFFFVFIIIVMCIFYALKLDVQYTSDEIKYNEMKVDVSLGEFQFNKLLMYDDEYIICTASSNNSEVVLLKFYIDSQRTELIAKIENCYGIYFSEMVNGKSYIGVVVNSGDYVLYEISLEGRKNIVFLQEKINKAPYVFLLPQCIGIIYEDVSETVLLGIYLETNECIEFDRTSFIRNSDGTVSGEYILYGGGFESRGFCYEILSIENTYIDAAKSSKIYFYDTIKREKSYLLTPERKSLYLQGNDNIIVTSEYEYEYPLQQSGYVYIKKAGKYEKKEITGIYNGNDICSAIISGKENIIIETGRKSYIFYGNSQKTIQVDFENKMSEIVKDILLLEDKIIYVVSGNDEVYLVVYNVEL